MPPPTMPPLPEAVSEELLLHFSILTRAGHNYRALLVLLAEEFPAVKEKILHHRELVDWSDSVIDAWHNKLGQSNELLN